MTQTTSDSEARRRLQLYFLDLRLRYALAVLFLGLVLVDFLLGKALLLGGLAWLGGTLALKAKRPSEREVDELLSRDLESLVQKAMRSLDPPEHEMQAAPLALFGPVEPDGRSRRSPVNRAVILVPMEDQLGVYSCQHDSIRDLTTQVSVEEHHYRDVVTVRLEQGGEALAGATQVFSLELANGRCLSVPVSVAWQEGRTSGAGAQPTSLEKTVLAIRALLRDKR